MSKGASVWTYRLTASLAAGVTGLAVAAAGLAADATVRADDPPRVPVPPATVPAEPFEYVGQVDGNLLVWERPPFSADGRAFVTVLNNVVRVWDARTLKRVGRPIVHPGMKACRLTADGRTVFTAGGRKVRFWDVATGEPRSVTTTAAELDFAEVSPDGARFVTVDKADVGRVDLWRVGEAKPVAALRHRRAVLSAEFDATGARIVTHEFGSARPFHVWSADAGREAFAAIVSDNENSFHMTSYQPQFDPAGRRLLVPQRHGFTVVDAATGRVLVDARWKDESCTTNTARFEAGGARVVVSTWVALSAGEARAFDAGTGAAVDPAFRPAAAECQIGPDGRWAMGLRVDRPSDGPPDVWDAATGVRVQSLAKVGQYVGSLAYFSPDGSTIVVDSETDYATVWRLRQGGPATRP